MEGKQANNNYFTLFFLVNYFMWFPFLIMMPVDILNGKVTKNNINELIPVYF
jgi:hypothetical protein